MKLHASGPLIGNMMRMNSDHTDYSMFQSIKGTEDHYVRVQVDLDRAVDLSDVGDENITYLRENAITKKTDIEKIAAFLSGNFDRKGE